MERIYHPYWLWEDYKSGFYDNQKKNNYIKDVLFMFNDYGLTISYMNKVLTDWNYSCEQNLTNKSINKIAYIGQAASNLYCGASCYTTMYCWNLLNDDVKLRSDYQAKRVIKKWELKKKLTSTLKNGKKEVIKMGYQTKLRMN